MKKSKLLIISVLMILTLTSCKTKIEENPIVTMEIENYGTIKIELYPSKAPNTVANFVNLIEEGFYDNLTFHRLVPGFVLQGGDPDGNGSGGPGYTIKGEFNKNGYTKNTISHKTGIISMARANDYDSAGSQFFIVLSDNVNSSLDNLYAGFGAVTEGMDIIHKIEKEAEIENEITGKLKENITITKMTVDTKGATYKVKKN